LLRTATLIFEEAARQNPVLLAQMAQNRRAFEAVAVLVENDPHGEAPEDPGTATAPH
jgi:hypothetical protein